MICVLSFPGASSYFRLSWQVVATATRLRKSDGSLQEARRSAHLEEQESAPASVHAIVRTRPLPLPPRVTADDRYAHPGFLATLGSEAVWLDYFTIQRGAT
jgi:hypothetical protein